uniref:MORN repeat-containing protein 5 n=1 Tax=Chromera velia CCMP2878 TaxID=1169474 RepID=A0A0G4FV33_9ALVE|eukprot:Cvel_18933.t1-p1 / transcript=Cvel_18933.t1 / gene=Cvel_18933 / organism=Chromera_velia_CCMP2878 / gene_product=Phosphatidylinositol 4-phosphate 5-kinase 1, putative / transcript_product=Phosphatidylinositol 4-phosphate 5-kinase 1, putative / location=Cvel_scaffold1597:40489-42025(+) / protein_length=170 / sequence_SO=supercontig / SO=protein_coding / is_pseudo=false
MGQCACLDSHGRAEKKVEVEVLRGRDEGYAPAAGSQASNALQKIGMTPGVEEGGVEGDLVALPEIKLEGGTLYTGQWRGTVREGEGVLERPDGGRYEGQFVNNRAEGYGKFFHANGERYEGQWKADKAHGFGTFYHEDGSLYEGQWVEDMMQGRGTEKWTDGSRFDGEYL